MAFFVEQQPQERKGKDNSRIPERPDLELLAIGKRAGLSFDEINMMRVQDLIEYARIFAGPVKDNKPRKATKADIDRFFSR